MYDVQMIARRIKLEAKKKGVTMKDLLHDCNLGINAVSQFAQGVEMSCISLAKIADVLNVSTDYLLGRTAYINLDTSEDM